MSYATKKTKAATKVKVKTKAAPAFEKFPSLDILPITGIDCDDLTVREARQKLKLTWDVLNEILGAPCGYVGRLREQIRNIVFHVACGLRLIDNWLSAGHHVDDPTNVVPGLDEALALHLTAIKGALPLWRTWLVQERATTKYGSVVGVVGAGELPKAKTVEVAIPAKVPVTKAPTKAPTGDPTVSQLALMKAYAKTQCPKGYTFKYYLYHNATGNYSYYCADTKGVAHRIADAPWLRFYAAAKSALGGLGDDADGVTTLPTWKTYAGIAAVGLVGVLFWRAMR